MILVTGGTGLVGAHLLYQLANAGKGIRATHRSNSDLEAVKAVFENYTTPQDAQKLYESISWIEADILDIPELDKAFKDIDYVYHCAGFISYAVNDQKKLRKVNIEGTANLVNLCLSQNIKKLCYVSSIASIGTTLGNSKITEETIWNPEKSHSSYAWSKYGGEMEVWRGTQEGLDAVIVNPGVIIGSGFWDSGSGAIFKRVNKGFPWKLKFTTGFVDVADVVKPMIALMESDIKNERFILVSENLRFDTVQTQIAKALNVKPPKRNIKKWMLFIVWLAQSIGRFLFGTKQTLTYDSVKNNSTVNRYNSKKLKKALGYGFIPVEESIKKTAVNFKASAYQK